MLTADNRFCTQDEEHDPSEDFEEWLTCAVCGDHCMLCFCGAGAKSLSLPLPLFELSLTRHPDSPSAMRP